MRNLKKMGEMGFFLNGSTQREFGELVLENLSPRNEIMNLKYDRQLDEFMVETTMDTYFQSDFTPLKVNGIQHMVYIFEMNQFKLMASARVLDENTFSGISYFLIYKG